MNDAHKTELAVALVRQRDSCSQLGRDALYPERPRLLRRTVARTNRNLNPRPAHHLCGPILSIY